MTFRPPHGQWPLTPATAGGGDEAYLGRAASGVSHCIDAPSRNYLLHPVIGDGVSRFKPVSDMCDWTIGRIRIIVRTCVRANGQEKAPPPGASGASRGLPSAIGGERRKTPTLKPSTVQQFRVIEKSQAAVANGMLLKDSNSQERSRVTDVASLGLHHPE